MSTIMRSQRPLWPWAGAGRSRAFRIPNSLLMRYSNKSEKQRGYVLSYAMLCSPGTLGVLSRASHNIW